MIAGLPPRITLIRVVAPLKSYSGSDYGGLTASLGAEQMERLEDENIKSSKDYLTKKVGQLKAKGINAEGEVIMGIVPNRLRGVRRAEQRRPDYYCHTRAFGYQPLGLG